MMPLLSVISNYISKCCYGCWLRLSRFIRAKSCGYKMRIGHKLVLGFLAVSLLVGVIGYICVNTSQKALQKSIGESSVSLATGVLDTIDRDIYSKIERFQSFQDPSLRETIIKSNQEFEKLDNIQDYINEKDQEWTSVPKEELTPFVKDLINSKLSKALRKRIKFYEEKCGRIVFAEIFVTNKYGANAAQTGKTTDYRQDDEEWWQMAKKDGLYVADVEYDSSADVYSTDIGIRIDDENNFIGVMKVVLNIEEVVNVITEAKAAAKYKTAQFKLTTKDGKLIYSTEDFRFFENISDTLLLHFKQEGEHTSYFIAAGDNPGEGEKLFAHAHSKGYRDFKGLGWVLAIEYETEEIFAPVAELRNNILIISFGVTVLAILAGLSISRVISRPISKLSAATVKISQGDLDTQIEVESKDEIGELAQSFNEMASKLKESYTHLEQRVKERTAELSSANVKLKQKIAEHIQTEEKLGTNRMELYKRTKFLSRVLESLPYPFYVIDANDYTIQMANSAAYPWTLPEKITCYMLSCGRDKPCEGKDHPCPLEEIKKTGEAVTVKHVHCDEDGNRRYIEFHGYPVHDAAGDISQIIEYQIDITDRKEAEEKVKHAAEEWRTTFDSITDLVSIHDKNFKILRVNKAFADVFKMEPKEVIGKTCYELVHGTKEPPPTCPHRQMVDSKEPKRAEFFEPCLGLYLEVSTSPIFDESGNFIGSVHISKDITDRKKIEEALRESESKYRTLFENLPQKIFLKDKDSVYVSCNENYAKDLKIRSEEIVGKTDYDFYPKKLAEKYRADDKRIMQSGRVEDIEEKYIRRGQERIVHTVKTPVKDDSGKTIGLLGIFWDITEGEEMRGVPERIEQGVESR